MPEIVEHLVIFKIKPDVDPAELPAMVDSLNSLAGLDGVLHLAAGPLINCRSTSLNFTHILHSRFASKEDMDKFYQDPDHHVVINQTKPFFEDLMAVDWVHSTDSVSIPPGSSMRATIFKLKGDLGDDEKSQLLEALGLLKDKSSSSIEVHSFGENNTPARAKGFSVPVITVFKDVNELEGFDSEWESPENEHRHLVIKPKVDEELVLDVVFP
ncbi:OLC1v1037851C1 [Oldenlandia corymbosa var. corymbosa]|uniref:OLC1v1037851C1 n=1 Tax=Oldenlandia corymbosa var. corymbosa TaxID=529605 RepID=A0AAV1D0M0_OLDCO|nr:OLC1v1037851C1 [Oldenlandia corymbosa var. corymbosa]